MKKERSPSEKYVSWDLDMGKYLDVTSKQGGGLWFHVPAPDRTDSRWKDICIGEGFKKSCQCIWYRFELLSGGGGKWSDLYRQITGLIEDLSHNIRMTIFS